MKFIQTYIVTGASQFPIDMLRYDGAFPSTERDSGKLTEACQIAPQPWSVCLTRYIELPTEKPNAERWNSFQVVVEEASIATRKI